MDAFNKKKKKIKVCNLFERLCSLRTYLFVGEVITFKFNDMPLELKITLVSFLIIALLTFKLKVNFLQ